MRFSLRVNNDLDIRILASAAVAADNAGFEQMWVSHDLMMRSAPALVGALAVKTERIHLGIGIMNPYSVHPAELAMTAATLQEISDGRFLLGLSAGAGEFLAWIGVEQQRPLSRTREALRAIRGLLAGQRPSEIDGTGADWTEHAYLRMPTQQVPIYLGAMSPKMLELAGREADGVLALSFPPEHFTTARSHVEDGAASIDRSMDSIDVPACVWLSVDEDKEKADRALAVKLAYYGASFSPYLLARVGLVPDDFVESDQALRDGDIEKAISGITPQMLRLGISGDPDSVVSRCQEIKAAGVSHLSFGPPLGADPVNAIELIGSEILPRLRDEPN